MPRLDRMRLIRPAPIEWLCLACGIVLTIHYAWLMDDAFVYFRYVDNLLFLDLGLVYNHGEYVEGFTSPLWTLVLVALRAAHFDYWLLVRLVGVGSFVALWACLVTVNRRLAPSNAPVVNVPLVYLTFNYGVLSSFTSGLETPLVQVLGGAYALLLVNPASAVAQTMVALSPLVRHELVLPFVVTVAWIGAMRRRPPWRLLAAAAGALTAWMLFRITYYAELFPNTYYLKNRVWVSQGFAYLVDTLDAYWPHVLLGLFLLLALVARRRGAANLQVSARLAMAAAALALVAFVVKIGGDQIHFRFLAFPTVLLVASGGGLAESTLEGRGTSRRVLALACGLLVALGSTFLYPRRLDPHPITLRSRVVGEHAISEAMLHRKRPELARDPWGWGRQHDKIDAYADYHRRHPQYRFERLVADYWCVRNYDHFDWYVVHSLGLTDPILARIDLPADRPGHTWSLHPLAQQIVQIKAPFGFGAGAFRRAQQQGLAPDWVEANLETIERIERRMFNRHRFLENLRLAFTPVGRIHLPSPPPEVPYRRGRRLGSRPPGEGGR